MTRYFFDVDFGFAFIHDDVGSGLPDLGAAKNEAALILVELARDMVRRGEMHPVTAVIREDAAGPKLRATLSVDFEVITEVLSSG